MTKIIIFALLAYLILPISSMGEIGISTPIEVPDFGYSTISVNYPVGLIGESKRIGKVMNRYEFPILVTHSGSNDILATLCIINVTESQNKPISKNLLYIDVAELNSKGYTNSTYPIRFTQPDNYYLKFFLYCNYGSNAIQEPSEYDFDIEIVSQSEFERLSSLERQLKQTKDSEDFSKLIAILSIIAAISGPVATIFLHKYEDETLYKLIGRRFGLVKKRKFVKRGS